MLAHRAATPGQVSCAAAMRVKSRAAVVLKQAEGEVSAGTWYTGVSGGRERGYVITLDNPGMWTTSAVHLAMKASRHCYLGVQGSETLWRATNSGLWSGHNWNWRPSKAYLK